MVINTNQLTKRVLITGATSGIGKEAAMLFAKADYQLILINRSKKKSKELQELIIEVCPNAELDFYYADFSDLHQVKNATSAITEKYSKIDIIISNAGMIDKQGATLPNGLETNFSINYMAAALVILGLKSHLAESGRILMVSSVAHKYGKLNDHKPGKSWIQNYGNSKLAVNLFVNKIADSWKEDGVCVNLVHPGVVATDIFYKSGWKNKWISPIVKLFMKRASDSAKEYYYLTTSEKMEGVFGKYFIRNKISKQYRNAHNREVQEALYSWTSSFFEKHELL